MITVKPIKKTMIMKKLVFLLVCLFTLQTVARADDDKPIQVTQMPQLAQQFIKQHFSDSKVALAKMESDFLYKSYEVIFTNGNKVEFDKKGNKAGLKKIEKMLAPFNLGNMPEIPAAVTVNRANQILHSF